MSKHPPLPSFPVFGPLMYACAMVLFLLQGVAVCVPRDLMPNWHMLATTVYEMSAPRLIDLHDIHRPSNQTRPPNHIPTGWPRP